MARQKDADLSIARNVLNLAVGFVTAVEEAGGTIEDARRAIFRDQSLQKRIGLLVMGKLKVMPCQWLVPHLIPDWVKEVVEDVAPTIVEGSKLSFHGYMQGDNDDIDGFVMRIRAVKMAANKGLSDVPALLGKDGKGLETIPAELRGKAYIVLPGTVLQHKSGHLCVMCLFWESGVGWYLDCRKLDSVYRHGGHLVSCE